MMMIEKITSATEKVASLINSGTEVNQAVVQVAKDLPKEAIKRVAENINVHNCLALFKSGEDRTKEFPLADPNIIFEQLGEEDIKNSYLITKQSHVPDNSFYTADIASNKRAGSGYASRNFLTKEAKAKYAICKAEVLNKRAEVLVDMETKLGSIARESFSKIASHVRTRPKATETLISALYDKYGNKSVDSLIFLAKEAGLKRLKIFDVDHTRFGDYSFFKHACYFIESVGGLEKLGLWGSALLGKLKKGKPTAAETAKAKEEWVARGWEREKEKYESGKKEESRKAYGESLKDIGGLGLADLAGAATAPIKAILAGALKARGSQLPKYGDVEKPDVSDNAILALRYKQNFEDLISDDEILKEKDPKELANYFQTMIRMAPHLAADKEILRAHLRQVSGQALMGPYDAKVLADLEETLHPTKRKK